MAILLALLIILPIAEIFVIVTVADSIGYLYTLLLLFLCSACGIAIVRRQGRAAMRRLNSALDERRVPAGNIVDGTLITLGGIALAIPGFITAAAGLLLLLPPTRMLARVLFGAFVTRRLRVVTGPAGWGADRMRRRQGGGRSAEYDYEAQAEDVTDRPPRSQGKLPSPGSDPGP